MHLGAYARAAGAPGAGGSAAAGAWPGRKDPSGNGERSALTSIQFLQPANATLRRELAKAELAAQRRSNLAPPRTRPGTSGPRGVVSAELPEERRITVPAHRLSGPNSQHAQSSSTLRTMLRSSSSGLLMGASRQVEVAPSLQLAQQPILHDVPSTPGTMPLGLTLSLIHI